MDKVLGACSLISRGHNTVTACHLNMQSHLDGSELDEMTEVSSIRIVAKANQLECTSNYGV